MIRLLLLLIHARVISSEKHVDASPPRDASAIYVELLVHELSQGNCSQHPGGMFRSTCIALLARHAVGFSPNLSSIVGVDSMARASRSSGFRNPTRAASGSTTALHAG